MSQAAKPFIMFARHDDNQPANSLDVLQQMVDAFDNGKRKHHYGSMNDLCLRDCQACAIERAKSYIAQSSAP